MAAIAKPPGTSPAAPPVSLVEVAEPELPPGPPPLVVLVLLFPEPELVVLPVGLAWMEETAPLGRLVPQSPWATDIAFWISWGSVQAALRQLETSLMNFSFLQAQGISPAWQPVPVPDTASPAHGNAHEGKSDKLGTSVWAATKRAAPRIEAMIEVFILIEGLESEVKQTTTVGNGGE